MGQKRSKAYGPNEHRHNILKCRAWERDVKLLSIKLFFI